MPLLPTPPPGEDDDPVLADPAAARVGPPQQVSAGLHGVTAALNHAVAQMGVVRAARTLPLVNQKRGFDCPGCAWPEGEHRHAAEFCENGAKAVAEEATRRRVDRAFFARHPVADLRERSDWWLGQQGRLTEPMIRRAGGEHYEPISWDEAFAVVADAVRALEHPDQAVFYTSGRTSNEAAFLYQLLARSLGTNNLPDCSNMCHESSGSALTQTIGIGKGTVSLDDFDAAELIVVAGQNPGTNHPRMLSTLERAKRRGAVVVSVNPLPEAGLARFKNPQSVRGLLGGGIDLADDWLQIRLGGDQALFQAIGALLLEADERRGGGVLDREFIASSTRGFDEYAAHLRNLDWSRVTAATGLEREQIERTARRFEESGATIVCWAMGLTQHPHAVATIRDVASVLFLQGNLGRPGAGLCPVRGHSNVQGDRTMGVWERAPESFLAALDEEFGIRSPRAHGLDTVAAIRALRDGRARVFVGMGGNFVRATPDSAVTEAALERAELTVQISTKLNRSHTVTGATALILPTLGRTERDVRGAGDPRGREVEQVVTVEDSMSVVHASRGRLEPASPHLRSEVSIVCGLALAVLGQEHGVPWRAFSGDYMLIRDSVSRVVPGFEDYEQKIARPGGFTLPHPPRDERRFTTTSGRAEFTVNPLVYPAVPSGRLLLQTIRSHDQFNTTVYGLDDRYRGVRGGRRVVFVNPLDAAELGLADGAIVDLVSEWPDGVVREGADRDGAAGDGAAGDGAAGDGAAGDGVAGVAERRAEGFRLVAYPTARGCAAAYFPETNVLVPLDSVAAESNTPTSKSIVVKLVPSGA